MEPPMGTSLMGMPRKGMPRKNTRTGRSPVPLAAARGAGTA